MTLSLERSVKREHKPFVVGTLGWTADDLDDPTIERLWEQGRYEIVEGVLTEMPPAQLDNSPPLLNLLFVLKQHIRERKLRGTLGIEVDVILDKRRVVIVDAAYLTEGQKKRQAQLYSKKPTKRPNVRYGRVMLAPSLIIESVSQGHEAHDRETKLKWYAEAGVVHYWILDPFRRSLDCYKLGDDRRYQPEATGKGAAKVRQSLFPALTISLGQLWER